MSDLRILCTGSDRDVLEAKIESAMDDGYMIRAACCDAQGSLVVLMTKNDADSVNLKKMCKDLEAMEKCG